VLSGATGFAAQPTRGGVLFDFSLWLSYFF
jgi:hypothetical protein